MDDRPKPNGCETEETAPASDVQKPFSPQIRNSQALKQTRFRHPNPIFIKDI
jgi:hypothetical protein